MSNTSSISTEEQLVLRVERELSNQLDSILKKLQQLAKDYSIETDKEKSPFKNVLAAATETPTSLEVIKNFIRYQGGRKPSKIWERVGFANALVQQLDSLSTDVDAILGRICKELKDKQVDSFGEDNDKITEPLLQYISNRDSDIRRSLHLQLTQLYLGYLSREHTALIGEKFNNAASDNQAVSSPPKDARSSNKPIRK